MNTNDRILLVEDDHCTRELIEEILTAEGYTLQSAKDGLEAKQLLETSTFSLLITDFRMPGLNGVELLKWCQAQRISPSVMFMSGNSNFFPEEILALNNSRAKMVTKPLNLDEFLETVSQTLNSSAAVLTLN